ncbi:MAG: UDP-N-acetylglucosamine 1-carboxyvinyltransferase [Eubacteriaceae bacterium]|nr:UDP-N-acetylglucosamine 1-carboxyvinyltransferase [Eubacteriaceae bacterium]
MADRIVIHGGVPLKGEVSISGAKNAALGILPAAILADSPMVIDNLPNIQDVNIYITMLEKLGAKLEREGDRLTVDPSGIRFENVGLIVEEATKLRASYYILGAFLSRFRKGCQPLPGGCPIGERPINLHILAFEALGAKVEITEKMISMEADELTGAEVTFDPVSVGATINAMLASVMAGGTTVLHNTAKEPHVVDVANCLNLMGARISGAGTDTIKIRGVDCLHGVTYSVVPDQIQAGTYMIAAAATCGDILVKNIIPEHLEALSSKLREMGNEVIEYDDSIRVIGHRPLRPVNIKTMPHPGFPTDLQQPMGVLMSLADGRSRITESIFESRFEYVGELVKMGADASLRTENVAVFNGVDHLTGTAIKATDLRAGAAMVIAGLAAQGTTEVYNLEHIERGYVDLVENFRSLGADIARVSG